MDPSHAAESAQFCDAYGLPLQRAAITHVILAPLRATQPHGAFQGSSIATHRLDTASAIARVARPSSPAGACRRGAENTRAALACSRSGFYIHTIGVTCARALFEPHQHALCRVVPPPPSPPVFPLCGLTNNGLHRRGSRYDHFCGQLPELSRATRTHVIQWVACVPPRDLRAPFFPPHLVAHSEACAPRQSVISKVIGVSNEVWRAEGGA